MTATILPFRPARREPVALPKNLPRYGRSDLSRPPGFYVVEGAILGVLGACVLLLILLVTK